MKGALTLLVSVSRLMQNVSVSPFLNLMPSNTFPKVSIDSMSPFCEGHRAKIDKERGITPANGCAPSQCYPLGSQNMTTLRLATSLPGLHFDWVSHTASGWA